MGGSGYPRHDNTFRTPSHNSGLCAAEMNSMACVKFLVKCQKHSTWLNCMFSTSELLALELSDIQVSIMSPNPDASMRALMDPSDSPSAYEHAVIAIFPRLSWQA